MENGEPGETIVYLSLWLFPTAMKHLVCGRRPCILSHQWWPRHASDHQTHSLLTHPQHPGHHLGPLPPQMSQICLISKHPLQEACAGPSQRGPCPCLCSCREPFASFLLLRSLHSVKMMLLFLSDLRMCLSPLTLQCLAHRSE